LAGPVVAAAVILPADFDLPLLTDSKKLTTKQRQELAIAIKAQAVTWAFGFSWPREIEKLNILQASLKAMALAVNNLSCRPSKVLVDGNQPIPRLDIFQQTIVKGDVTVPQISAASILAKTIRDKVMQGLDKRYPGYGLARHKGYATSEHLAALQKLGPAPIHRFTFKPIRQEKWLPLT